MKKNPRSVLPRGTFVQLGEKFGSALHLTTARKVTSVETLSVGKGKHLVCVNINGYPSGDHGATIRSGNLTWRQARALQREATRKIAVFIFENPIAVAA